jgi:hypothetical protein
MDSTLRPQDREGKPAKDSRSNASGHLNLAGTTGVNAKFKCLTTPQIEMSGFDFVFGFGF